ncbi:DUF2388 domain-containing protein [Pseudomonas sp. G11-1]|uniref:DUF2388 domain-containing protein n=1 Tax=Halopseudomonas bauzanensis TaxID=653930 RepID=A0A031MKA8_9GAMM|nr:MULTISPECIES: DUF2388 domain-containing protein [Halopseudomonas]MCO5787636.1 DUF2388 domain-containing protein [Pseudomonas sp. G11-1]MCO5790862.1 DUF2388 domain-containing protein [Pseudomonas sp. G11-2]EZQ20194.1 hypothetical protein CF98_07245 [Halopseudomonas bauzanensis]TKA91346.1 DUF2388 domain-containing protein [Halopseudomonas bauzanensis]WGK63113.1 DUF2388 domain-containing protein [Halopseudomonas sp. SMJS2]
MQRLSLVIATTGLLALAGAAHGSSFIGTTDAIAGSLVNTIDATSDATTGNNKVVLEAREDAASFVGSDGQLRSARLEAALLHIRQSHPDLEATDLQLAEAILAL